MAKPIKTEHPRHLSPPTPPAQQVWPVRLCLRRRARREIRHVRDLGGGTRREAASRASGEALPRPCERAARRRATLRLPDVPTRAGGVRAGRADIGGVRHRLVLRARARGAPKTRTDYSWRLNHLVRWFGPHRLSSIDVDRVDGYKAHKLAEAARLNREWETWRSKPPAERGEKPDRRALGARAINMHLILPRRSRTPPRSAT